MRRSELPRIQPFNPDHLGQNTLRLIGNFCFAIFVAFVVAFTVIAATYQPDDPLLRPSKRINSFLTSTSNATFESDGSAIKTGDDFITTSDSVPSVPFINVSDVAPIETKAKGGDCAAMEAVQCSVPEIFHLMMRAAIETFTDVHFYKFGKPVRAENETSCDMAWRFRPKNAKRAGFYKDYRRFNIGRNGECEHVVLSIGDYHTGVNARKKKPEKDGNSDGDGDTDGFELTDTGKTVPVVGEAVNDTIPVIGSEEFRKGKYLLYTGPGESCKNMDHYMWSLLCSLGEAIYLNRTLVMDLSLCLSSKYTGSNQHEQGRDFRFYFDFEHLRKSASVLDQSQFWTQWGKWLKKDGGMTLHLVEDFRTTPMTLVDVKDELIMRKFGSVEPDNYWYRVCEGETESVIQRPWHLIWKSRRLMDIVSAISSKLNWDFDTVHVVRGEKLNNPTLWPNLAADTSPERILAKLKDRIDDGRKLYITTDETDPAFFDALKDKYEVHLLNEYQDLWGENSEWYKETKQLNSGIPVEFDLYMKSEVDMEVFLRGKKQLETFNDLTSDCKDGINTCKNAAS